MDKYGHILYFTILIGLQYKVTLSDMPDWSMPNYDAFEYQKSRMACTVKSVPCSPTFIYIQKYVMNKWENAAIVSNNGTYEPLNGHIGDRGSAGYQPFLREFHLTIDPLQLQDNGNWRCQITNCPDDIASREIYLTVSTVLNEENVTIITPGHILLNTPSQYTCSSDRVYPEVNVTWIQGGDISYGEPDNNFDGESWKIENTNTFTFCERDKMEVGCLLKKTSGTNEWNVTKHAVLPPVYAPAVIENSGPSHTNPTTSDVLVIFCLASGTSRNISWKKDGDNLPDGLFNLNNKTIHGSFTCEEPEATNSTITWIQHENVTCGDVTDHDGNYQCIVTAKEGTPACSSEHEIEIHHPPILETNKKDEEAMEGSTITLYCTVSCAKPKDLNFAWTSFNERDGLNSNSSTVVIRVEANDFNDTFICTVSNAIGSNSMKFKITQILVPPTTSTTEDLTTFETTTDSGNVTTPKPLNTALIIANAVIWSLCGIVSIVLVCLALYHYRQIQNGKKYQADDSEEIVLTHDEEKPGTSHGFGSGEYDDISHSEAGEVTVSVAFDEVTTDGLYAEVQKSAQTQMPVAPKRVSKVKTSQPESSTPQAKRTNATNAPKSPMDARHQPNSHSLARRQEPQADYSPASKRKDIPPSHSSGSNHGMASKVVEQQKRHESPNKQAAVKQNAKGTKPSVPVKPDIQSFRSSRSSGIIPAGAPYDNAEVNLYANCDQRPEPKNGDGTITYADLALQQEDPYEEGAPPVPKKNMTDQEPVQYASIKRNK